MEILAQILNWGLIYDENQRIGPHSQEKSGARRESACNETTYVFCALRKNAGNQGFSQNIVTSKA